MEIKIDRSDISHKLTCDGCLHAKTCQFYIEIFDHHSSYKHTIRQLRLVNYVAQLCRHFNQYEIDWSTNNDTSAEAQT